MPSNIDSSELSASGHGPTGGPLVIAWSSGVRRKLVRYTRLRGAGRAGEIRYMVKRAVFPHDTVLKSSDIRPGHTPIRAEATASTMSGINIDADASLKLFRSAREDPMKMRFRGQKVYAAVKAVAKTPQIAIASFMGSPVVELKSVEKRAISA